MCRVFNMGIGYTIIARPDQADRMMKILKRSGEKPMIIGSIEKGTGEVRLK